MDRMVISTVWLLTMVEDGLQIQAVAPILIEVTVQQNAWAVRGAEGWLILRFLPVGVDRLQQHDDLPSHQTVTVIVGAHRSGRPQRCTPPVPSRW